LEDQKLKIQILWLLKLRLNLKICKLNQEHLVLKRISIQIIEEEIIKTTVTEIKNFQKIVLLMYQMLIIKKRIEEIRKINISQDTTNTILRNHRKRIFLINS